jgi:hypothetical protein
VLSLSPQFFTKSSAEEKKLSKSPCKPRRICLKGFGWAMESEDDGRDSESHQQEASQCASTDFVRDQEGMGVPDIV